MADLTELDRAGAVKIAGSAPSTGLEDNFMEVDSNGYIGARLYAASGSSINLGQAVMASSLPVVIASNQSAIPVAQSGSWTVAATQSGTWSTGRTWTLASGTDAVTAAQGGTWNINNISGTISLPTGAATSALQTSGNASLTSIDSKAPALGQALMAASVPVTFASNQSTLPISAASLPLPAGASTSALQTSGNASLTSIDSKLTSPLAVTGPLTDAQLRASAVPVSASSLPLPTGAATETTLSAINTKTPALGQALAAASVPVVLTAAQLSTLTPLSTVAVTQSTSPWVVSAASLPLPTGAATETTLSALNTKVTTTANGIKVDGSAVTQPVSAASLPLPTGAATSANQSTEITSLQLIDNAIGSVGAGTAGTNSWLIGGVFNTSLPTLTNGQQAASQLDSSGRLIIAPLANTSTVKAQVQDNAGNGLTSTLINSKQRLDVDVTFSGQDNVTAPFFTGQVGGQDSTGKLQAFIVAPSGEQFVKDVINVAGQFAALSVTTTATLAKGGASALVNRKFVSITPTNGTVYWGTSASVTTANGSPIFKNQTVSFAFSENVTIYLIAAATVDTRIVEGS